MTVAVRLKRNCVIEVGREGVAGERTHVAPLVAAALLAAGAAALVRPEDEAQVNDAVRKDTARQVLQQRQVGQLTPR